MALIDDVRELVFLQASCGNEPFVQGIDQLRQEGVPDDLIEGALTNVLEELDGVCSSISPVQAAGRCAGSYGCSVRGLDSVCSVGPATQNLCCELPPDGVPEPRCDAPPLRMRVPALGTGIGIGLLAAGLAAAGTVLKRRSRRVAESDPED